MGNVIKQTIQIDGIAKLDVSQIEAASQRARTSMANIEMPKSLKTDMTNALNSIDGALEKVKNRSKATFSDIGEVKKMQSAYNELDSALQRYDSLLKTASSHDLKLALPKNAIDQINAFRDAFKQTQAEIKKTETQLNNSLGKYKGQANLGKDLNEARNNKDFQKNIDDRKVAIDKEVQAKQKELDNIQKRINQLETNKDKVDKASKTGRSKTTINSEIKNKTAELKRLEQEAQGLSGGAKGANTKKQNNLRQELAQLETEYKKVDAAQQKFKQTTEQLGTSSQIDKDIKNLQKQKAETDKLISSLKNEDTQLDNISDDFQKLSNLENKTFDTSGLSTGLKELGITMPEVVNGVTQLDSALNNIDDQRVTQVDQKIEELKQDLDGAGQETQQLGQQIEKSMNQGMHIENMTQQINNLSNQFMYFFSLQNGWNLLRRGLQQAMETVKELDEAMTEIAVVSEYTVDDIWAMRGEYIEAATAIGASTIDLVNASKLYVQQGLALDEAMKIGIETTKMARIANIDGARATDLMTAAIRGFRMEMEQANEVNDVYSNLAAKSAADTEQIAVAMSKTASIANNAGASFANMSAFLTQIIETTQEGAETAGTAMKTVIARFQELKKPLSEIGEVEGEMVDANNLEKALRQAGIALRDTNGEFRDFDDVIIELAANWDTIDMMTQRYIATMAAGSRQQSRFLALMSDNERLTELMGYANESAGASAEQFEDTLDSLEAKMNKMNNALERFYTGLANNKVIKMAIDLITQLLDVVNRLLSPFTESENTMMNFFGSFLEIGMIIAGLQLIRSLIIKTLTSIVSDMGIAGQQGGTKFMNNFKAGMKGVFTGGTFKELGQNWFGGFSKEGRTAISSVAGKEMNYGQIDRSFNGEEIIGTWEEGRFNRVPNPSKDAIERAKLGKDGLSYKKTAAGALGNLKGRDRQNMYAGLGKQAEKQMLDVKDTGAAERAQQYLDEYNAEIAKNPQNTEKAFNNMMEKVNTDEYFKEHPLSFKVDEAAMMQTKASIQGIANSLNQVAMAAGAVAGAFMGLSMIAGMFGEEGKELSEALSTIAMVFMAISMILPVISKGGAALGNVLMAAGIKVQAAWWPFLLITLALIAVIGIVAVVLSVMNKKVETAADRLEKAKETLKEFQEALENSKNELSEMESALDAYKDKKKVFDGLIKGTTEWKKAMIEMNMQVQELLTKYPQLAQYVKIGENGEMTLNEGGMEAVLEAQQDAVNRAYGAVVTQRNKVLDNEYNADVERWYENKFYSGVVKDGEKQYVTFQDVMVGNPSWMNDIFNGAQEDSYRDFVRLIKKGNYKEAKKMVTQDASYFAGVEASYDSSSSNVSMSKKDKILNVMASGKTFGSYSSDIAAEDAIENYFDKLIKIEEEYEKKRLEMLQEVKVGILSSTDSDVSDSKYKEGVAEGFAAFQVSQAYQNYINKQYSQSKSGENNKKANKIWNQDTELDYEDENNLVTQYLKENKILDQGSDYENLVKAYSMLSGQTVEQVKEKYDKDDTENKTKLAEAIQPLLAQNDMEKQYNNYLRLLEKMSPAQAKLIAGTMSEGGSLMTRGDALNNNWKNADANTVLKQVFGYKTGNEGKLQFAKEVMGLDIESWEKATEEQKKLIEETLGSYADNLRDAADNFTIGETIAKDLTQDTKDSIDKAFNTVISGALKNVADSITASDYQALMAQFTNMFYSGGDVAKFAESFNKIFDGMMLAEEDTEEILGLLLSMDMTREGAENLGTELRKLGYDVAPDVVAELAELAGLLDNIDVNALVKTTQTILDFIDSLTGKDVTDKTFSAEEKDLLISKGVNANDLVQIGEDKFLYSGDKTNDELATMLANATLESTASAYKEALSGEIVEGVSTNQLKNEAAYGFLTEYNEGERNGARKLEVAKKHKLITDKEYEEYKNKTDDEQHEFINTKLQEFAGDLAQFLGVEEVAIRNAPDGKDLFDTEYWNELKGKVDAKKTFTKEEKDAIRGQFIGAAYNPYASGQGLLDTLMANPEFAQDNELSEALIKVLSQTFEGAEYIASKFGNSLHAFAHGKDVVEANKAFDELGNHIKDNAEAIKKEAPEAMDKLLEFSEAYFGAENVDMKWVKDNKELLLQLSKGGDAAAKALVELNKSIGAFAYYEANFKNKTYGKNNTKTVGDFTETLTKWIEGRRDAGNNSHRAGISQLNLSEAEMDEYVKYLETSLNATITRKGTELFISDKDFSLDDPNQEKNRDDFDWLQETITNLEQTLRSIEKTERERQKILDNESKTAEQRRQELNNNYSNGNDGRKELREKAKTEAETIKRERATREYDRRVADFAKLGLGDLTNYIELDKDTGYVTIHNEAIGDQRDLDDVQWQKLLESVHYIEDIGKDIQEQNDTLEQIADDEEDEKQAAKEQAMELERKIYDAIVDERQKEIDKLSEINDSINDANAKLLEKIQSDIDERRQEREEDKQLGDIQDMQERLSLLRADTSGMNALEIKKMEEELANAEESYTDMLVDKQLEELTKANDEAYEQRQRQIELMQEQLEADKQNGVIAEQSYGVLLSQDASLIGIYLQNDEEFKSMTIQEQAQYLREMQNLYAEAMHGMDKFETVDRNAKWMLDFSGKFASGGMNYTTGPAWLDGTKSRPEAVLNAEDTKNFIALLDILSSTNGLQSANAGNTNYIDIDVHVDEISDDYDVDQVIERVKESIYNDANYRNVNTVGF